jgi:hypothetical protein
MFNDHVLARVLVEERHAKLRRDAELDELRRRFRLRPERRRRRSGPVLVPAPRPA